MMHSSPLGADQPASHKQSFFCLLARGDLEFSGQLWHVVEMMAAGDVE
jgi:hypothetical protein